MNNISIEIINRLNENYPLLEMAYSKNKLEDYINNRCIELKDHLILCFVYKNKYKMTVHHWASEIYGFLHDCPKLKTTNTYPTYEQLEKWCLNSFTDIIKDNIDSRVQSEKSIMKYKSIPDYNKDEVYNKVVEYFKWLFINFSEKGEVTFNEVENKIKELQK